MNPLPFTHVLKTIQLIKDSFVGAEIVYTQGSCVKLAMILKHIYPEGKILYDINHAIFEYQDKYFDINGYAEKTKQHIPIEDYGILQSYQSMNLKHNQTCKHENCNLPATCDGYCGGHCKCAV